MKQIGYCFLFLLVFSIYSQEKESLPVVSEVKELKNIPLDGRTARYQCVIVYMPFYDHPLPKIYNGTWEGYIGFEEKGENGFGYDPLFFLPDFECTAAQLSEEQKNKISHRGKALSLFKKDFLE